MPFITVIVTKEQPDRAAVVGVKAGGSKDDRDL